MYVWLFVIHCKEIYRQKTVFFLLIIQKLLLTTVAAHMVIGATFVIIIIHALDLSHLCPVVQIIIIITV